MTPELLPANMPTQLKELITHSNVQEARLIEAKLDYGMFSVDLNEESKGIQKLFEVFCPIIDIILKDKIKILRSKEDIK